VLYIDNLNFDNLIVSVPEQLSKGNSFNLYPNPASEFVNLNFDYQANYKLSLNIYNMIGEMISSESDVQNGKRINTDNLISGIYFMEIKADQWSEKQKLIIQK
jgi:hypothetical protein